MPGYPVPLDGAPSVTGWVALGVTDREGNCGRVSAAAVFQRVDRAPPPAPGAFTLGNVDELLATEPDAYGKSRFTLTWEPGATGVRHVVYRALDAAVLARHGMTMAQGRALDPGELLALAAHPVAEPAFSQLTSEPVTGSSFTDARLEGFGSNRYFYRVRTVSLAGVLGELGEPTPPVAVPDVVPPRPPRVVRALGGDQVVTLTFTPNREHDIDHYLVYRAVGPAAAADTRRMTMVGVVPHDPTAAAFSFTDGPTGGSTSPPPEPRSDLRYRVTAVTGPATSPGRPGHSPPAASPRHRRPCRCRASSAPSAASRSSSRGPRPRPA